MAAVADKLLSTRSALVSACEAQPLINAATQAALPPPTEDATTLGRGQRKRSNASMAELGEHAFKRMVREGKLSAAGAPFGLRKIVLLGSERARMEAIRHSCASHIYDRQMG